MIHFHSLAIKKIRKETADCVVITFEVPEALQERFRFIQGQNLTLRTVLNGTEVRRNYSICSSPFDKELAVAVKKVTGGLFSTFANEVLKKGDRLEVMPPTGNFYTPLHPSQTKNYVAFAAGSGITPILSIIKTTLLKEPHSRFTLVYGNRTRNSILFKEELEALKDKFISRFQLIHILSREKMDSPINEGRLDVEKCNLLFDKLIDIQTTDAFFICGPEALIFCIKNLLEKRGISKDHIHFELFTVPGQKGTSVSNQPTENNTAAKSQISIKLDGIWFHFDLEQEGISILDAALNEGADLPYACKGGVCTTCRAKLTEGEVKMDINWGLESEEVKKGFILTCQSHPTTAKVTIDYDRR